MILVGPAAAATARLAIPSTRTESEPERLAGAVGGGHWLSRWRRPGRHRRVHWQAGGTVSVTVSVTVTVTVSLRPRLGWARARAAGGLGLSLGVEVTVACQ